MGLLRSLIFITILLLAYTNASAQYKAFKPTGYENSTDSFLGQKKRQRDYFKKKIPENSDEGILNKLKDEKLVNEKITLKNPIVVPTRSQLVLARAHRKKPIMPLKREKIFYQKTLKIGKLKMIML